MDKKILCSDYHTQTQHNTTQYKTTRHTNTHNNHIFVYLVGLLQEKQHTKTKGKKSPLSFSFFFLTDLSIIKDKFQPAKADRLGSPQSARYRRRRFWLSLWRSLRNRSGWTGNVALMQHLLWYPARSTALSESCVTFASYFFLLKVSEAAYHVTKQS